MQELSIGHCLKIWEGGFDDFQFSGTHKEMPCMQGQRQVYSILNVYLLINFIKNQNYSMEQSNPKIKQKKAPSLKVCGLCGKSESWNWARHWKNNHPGAAIVQLLPGEIPSNPYDESWLRLISPISVRKQFMTPAEIEELEINQEQKQEPDPVVTMQDIHEIATQYIEIDVESDDVVESEEVKVEEDGEDIDLQSLPTKTLFKKAGKILTIIQERLKAKDASIRDRLSFQLREPQMTEKLHVRHLYPSVCANHLNMSRVLNDQCINSSIPKQVLSSIQFTSMQKIEPKSQYTIDYLFTEQKRVRNHISSLDKAIDTLHDMSLPLQLTMNECNTSIQVVESSLKIRSRKLLKRSRGKVVPKAVFEEHSEMISQPADPAIYCPLLYAPCDSSSEDSEPEGQKEIKTSDIGDSGDDLTDGILAVDGVRFLLNKVREEVKDIQFLDLRDGLLKFLDGRRAYLKRRLQYFLNMLLFPRVGYGRYQVRIIFEGSWLDPREFTVNVKAKERRGYMHNSSFFLRSLQEATQDISDTLVEVMDFARAVGSLKVVDDDCHLLKTLYTKVLHAVAAIKHGKESDQKYRLHMLQKTLLEQTERLNEPDILTTIRGEQHVKKYWMSVDLKAHVNSRIRSNH